MEDLGLIRTVSQTKMGRSQTGTDPVNQRLLGLLNAHPQDVGDLGRLVGQATTNLYGDLLLLELMGLAYRTPDGKWLKLALL
jgi:predicted Rossmann fold nucleotide-binding protein DprA/Smf involved in DNA uptake